MYADISVTIRRANWRQLLAMVVAAVFVLATVAVISLWHAGDVRLLSVQTGSMAPAVRPGDAVLVRPVDMDDLMTGDIISYHSPAGQGLTITHRVVEVDRRRDVVVTQGDMNDSPDRPVEGRALIGRVERQYAGLGYVIDVVRSPVGLAVGVYLPAALMTRAELRRLTEFFQPGYRHPMHSAVV